MSVGWVRAAAPIAVMGVALLGAAAPPAHPQSPPQPQVLTVGYLGRNEPVARPASPLDVAAVDEGLQGARLGIADNETTGRFIGQSFRLRERRLDPGEDVGPALGTMRNDGIRFVVADLAANDLIAAADTAAGGAAEGTLLLFNVRATDDRLRNEDCRANILHVAPSRAMLADALAQYLAVKDWRRWFLVVGPRAEDAEMAQALKRSVARFGHRITAEKAWTLAFGPGRADSGHVGLQAEIPTFTRVGDYDVLVVADEGQLFGDYLLDRTALPRLVAGTQGLVPTAWSVVHEQWGAAQLQDRFRQLAGRPMTARDYAAWLAVRAVGEAAVRTRSIDPERLAAYMRGPEFLLAGFKGRGLSFRAWDGQLRQPVLLAGPKLLVSVSPQPGFLHERTELDTLGYDLGESRCKLP